MCGGPFSRSFIQKYPASSPSPFISLSLSCSLSLLAIQQVDHRAYAAPSTVGPTQLPRVTSWLRGLLCNKSEFPRVSFRGSRVLRDFPRVSFSLSLSLPHPSLSFSLSIYTEYVGEVDDPKAVAGRILKGRLVRRLRNLCASRVIVSTSFTWKETAT